MTDQARKQYQIIISGVGGQGVLFVTRLLAEAAIRKNLPVYTSETHGMAQRGGTVISHLKVGHFSSPLIQPGAADGLISLKAEGLEQHGGYVMPQGWAVVNSNKPPGPVADLSLCHLDADHLAQKLNTPRSLNLIMLGFALSDKTAAQLGHPPLYCTHDDILDVLESRLNGKDALFNTAVKAVEAGLKPAVE